MKQNEANSSLKSTLLKRVVQFTLLDCNISTRGSDLHLCIKKKTATDRFLIRWKSNLSDLIKQKFFETLAKIWVYPTDVNETLGEKVRWEQHKDVAYCFEQTPQTTPKKTTGVLPLASHL